MIKIGLISDTHGLLRPQAIAALQGCDRIVHGGDVGTAAVLTELAGIAPVSAVRGNNDFGDWASVLPETDVLDAGGARILVIHDRNELAIDPQVAGCRVVVSGHSHRPGFDWQDGVLYINPGSAGPRRFTLPISLCYLHIDGDRITPELIELAI